MAQYIEKDALVAEIERLIERAKAERVLYPKTILAAKNYLLIEDYKKILSFLDTLEVKEVDLEKEIKEQSDKYYSQCEKKLQEMDDNDKDLSFLSLDNFAKHFFELGLKAQKGE